MKRFIIFATSLLFGSIFSQAQTLGVTDLGAGTVLQNVCPADGTGTVNGDFDVYPFNSVCYTTYAAWGSGDIDTSRNRLVFWGEGHSDSHAMTIYALYYNQVTPIIKLIHATDPFCNLGFTANTKYCTTAAAGTGIQSSSCPTTTVAGAKNCWINDNNTPVAAHPFGTIVYMPTVDAMFRLDGTYPPGTDKAFTWWLQFTGDGIGANTSWVGKDPVPDAGVYCNVDGAFCDPLQAGMGPAGVMASWDSTDNTVIVGSIAAEFLLKYYPTGANANRYKTLNHNLNGTAGTEGMQCAFAPTQNYWICIGTGNTGQHQAIYIDMGGGDGYITHDVTSTANSTCTNLFIAWPGFSYDSLTDKIVGWPSTGNTVTIMDPSTFTCTNKTVSPGPIIPALLDLGNGTFGKFRYTPDIPGSFVVVGAGSSVGDAYKLGIDPITPTITNPPNAGAITSGTQLSAYTYTFTASGTTPITWSIISGTTPTGLSLNASTGILSGIPTSCGSYSFTIQASNTYGTPPTQNDTLSIACVCLFTSTNPLPGAKLHIAYSYTLTTTGCSSPTFSWTPVVTGFNLNTSTGAITGTSASSGLFNTTISISDTSGNPTFPTSITVVPGPGTGTTGAITSSKGTVR